MQKTPGPPAWSRLSRKWSEARRPALAGPRKCDAHLFQEVYRIGKLFQGAGREGYGAAQPWSHIRRDTPSMKILPISFGLLTW